MNQPGRADLGTAERAGPTRGPLKRNAAKMAAPRITALHWRILLIASSISILIAVLAARAISRAILEPAGALAATALTTILLFVGGAAIHSRSLQERTRQRDAAQTAREQSDTRLLLAQTAAGIATVDWNLAEDHAVWSSNFVDVFGIPGDASAARTPYELFIELVHPEDRTRIDAMHIRVLRTGGAFSEEFRINSPDGAVRWIATRGEVLRDDNGKPHRLLGANFDITERRRSEDRLKQSLAIIELANESGEIGIWNSNPAVRAGRLDQRARSIFGLPADEERVDLKIFRDAIHTDDWNRVRSVLIQSLKSGDKFTVECRIRRPDLAVRWIRIRGQADIDALTRRAVRMTGIVFDITERREREAHLRFLMRELTHRSKNLLAVIQAMARQTGGTAVSLDDFQSRFSARLHGLAVSHDLLVNEDWQGAFLADIVRSQVEHFADLASKRLVIEGDNVQLKPEAAQNIGLALHELATNAAKFGALANADGKVSISWSVITGAADGKMLQIIWRESGGPPVEPPTRRGFGSSVIERVVARALDGRVSLTFEPGGVVWTLETPMSYLLPNNLAAAGVGAAGTL